MSDHTKLRYYVDGVQDESDAKWFQCYDNDHCSAAAEAAAENYHGLGGWEASWPVVIVLVDEDGQTSRWTVERESIPTFDARRAP